MMETRGTQERFTVRELVNTRGRTFTLALLKPLPEEIIARVFYGLTVADGLFAQLQKILKERMTD
jgi:hypothetical protein